MGVQLVEGGQERHDSVAAGLAAVSDEAEYVAIHDAARVCVAVQWIDNVFEAATQSGAAIPVVPVSSTLKRLAEDGTISDTVSREGLHMAQTPQVFRKDIISQAYASLQDKGPASISDLLITDDAQVVAAAGTPVTTIKGDARNMKITTKDDLKLAAAVLKALPQKPTSKRGAFEEAQW